jgi:hypothetical protein
MTRRGRPANDRVKTNIYIEGDILGELEIYLIDPIKGKLRYGVLSNLANGLFAQFLAYVRRDDVDINEAFSRYGIELLKDETENL